MIRINRFKGHESALICIVRLHSLPSITQVAMASVAAASDSVHSDSKQSQSPVPAIQEKPPTVGLHHEHASDPTPDFVYEDEEEPEFHTRTYFALIAMFLLNFVQVLALQGPPAVVS